MKDTQYHINQLRRQKMTWQQIGDLIGISRALAWRVGHGKCDSLTARHYFGLPPKLIEVEPCRVCGEAHTKKRCTTTYKAGSRKRLAFDVPNDLSADDIALYKSSMREHSRLILDKIRNS